MHIVFTYRMRNLLSWLIRRVTREPVSHVAIVYGDFVAHATARGLTIESISSFNKHNVIQFSVDISHMDNILPRIQSVEYKPYDIPGLVYLGIRALLPHWVRRQMPKVNLWNVSGAYICTEFVTDMLYGKPDSMITPYQLYRRLSGDSYEENK
jgi:hypothetical protein